MIINNTEQEGSEMPKITPDMIVADVLKLDKGTVPIFLNNGMFCLGCPSSTGESIQEACSVHGMDVDKLVRELNEFFDKK
jgi:hybrid cluster-associated redox disulfide protein